MIVPESARDRRRLMIVVSVPVGPPDSHPMPIWTVPASVLEMLFMIVIMNVMVLHLLITVGFVQEAQLELFLMLMIRDVDVLNPDLNPCVPMLIWMDWVTQHHKQIIVREMYLIVGLRIAATQLQLEVSTWNMAVSIFPDIQPVLCRSCSTVHFPSPFCFLMWVV